LICGLLDSLGPSLRCLKVDTKCWYEYGSPVNHVYSSIRRLLPQLSNLHLEVANLCKNIIPNWCSWPNIGRSQSFIVNFCGNINSGCAFSQVCYEQDSKSGNNPDFVATLSDALDSAFANSSTPDFRKCSIIDWRDLQGGCTCSLEFDTIFETQVFPVLLRTKYPDYIVDDIGAGMGVVRMLNGDRNKSNRIVHAPDVDTDSWTTTSDGYRVPEVHAYSRQMIIKCSGAPTEQGMLRAKLCMTSASCPALRDSRAKSFLALRVPVT
jgi:hypothetical protein